MEKLPLKALNPYETSVACRQMIRAGIPKSEVSAYLQAEQGPGSLSLAYLEVRWGRMWGPRKAKTA